MPSIDDFNKSQFLKKEDVDPPVTATIAGCELQDFDDGRKLIVKFRGDVKPLVAGSKVNREAVADIAGTRDYSQWAGTRIELYKDGNVYDLSGRRVGGIRIRPAARAAAAATTDDDLAAWEESL